jgi:hypothetical protein
MEPIHPVVHKRANKRIDFFQYKRRKVYFGAGVYRLLTNKAYLFMP